MRKLLFLFILGWMPLAHAQVVTALCDVLGDVESYRTANTMNKLAGEERNLDGSVTTNIIPARFSETSFRDLGDAAYMLEFRSYGSPKQMEKVLKLIFEEIARCYPNHIQEASELNSDNFRKFFFCLQEDAGGSGNSSDYRNFTFTITILHTEGDESKITLKF